MAIPHYYLPHDIDGIEQLAELALDLRWSWNHSDDGLWGQFDPELWALTLKVELYADPIDDNGSMRQEMRCDRHLVGALRGYVYTAQVPTSRPASDYTVRVVPYHPDAVVPLEAAYILWQR